MQADLFNLSISNNFERQAFQKSFFEKKYTLRLDQLLGMGLVMIVFFVLVFAWGVEHGKAAAQRDVVFQNHSALSQTQTPTVPEHPTTTAAATTAAAPAAPLTSPPIEIVTNRSNTDQVDSSSASTAIPAVKINAKYTIAHIIYLRKDQALRETERIQSKNVEARMVPNGRYFQICVGAYATRKEASDGLKALQSKGLVSEDSYIRNMPARTA